MVYSVLDKTGLILQELNCRMTPLAWYQLSVVINSVHLMNKLMSSTCQTSRTFCIEHLQKYWTVASEPYYFTYLLICFIDFSAKFMHSLSCISHTFNLHRNTNITKMHMWIPSDYLMPLVLIFVAFNLDSLVIPLLKQGNGWVITLPKQKQLM